MSYRTLELRLPEHREFIARLWADNLAPSVVPLDQRLRWFYEENPLGAAHTVLAQHEEAEEMIGCGSAFPRAMCVDGSQLTAGILADFAVDKKHRLGGPAILIQRALCSSSGVGFDFLFGFPNSLSLPIVKRVGYQPVGEASAWVKPLHAAYKLKSILRSDFLGHVGGVVVDAGLVAWDSTRVFPPTWRFAADIEERADQRFDELWLRARVHYPVVGEKSAAFLNWRYTGFKDAKYSFFTFSERQTGRLAGYICFRVDDRKVFIVDLFAADREKTLDRLLMAFAGRMRREGFDSIYVGYVGDQSFAQRLERLGFFRSPDIKRQLVVYVGSRVSENRRRLLLDQANWLIFDGDLDI